jgi:hypothetical protein
MANDISQHVSRVIDARTGAGPSDMVAGWQRMLGDLLAAYAAYLRPGELVTFQQVEQSEEAFFEQLRSRLTVPPEAVALFLPPSVRHQMMGDSPSAASDAQDSGSLIASRAATFAPIVNVLFTRPPYTCGVDVYAQKSLLAGYAFASPEACLRELSQILHMFLASS